MYIFEKLLSWKKEWDFEQKKSSNDNEEKMIKHDKKDKNNGNELAMLIFLHSLFFTVR